jgi:hypothetical protein
MSPHTLYRLGHVARSWWLGRRIERLAQAPRLDLDALAEACHDAWRSGRIWRGQRIEPAFDVPYRELCARGRSRAWASVVETLQAVAWASP